MPSHDVMETRARYRHFTSITTRWMDNDLFGHVNNVVYHAYIDTVVCNYYMECGRTDVTNSLVIPVAAETHCTFKRSIRHPSIVEAGVRADHIGNRSLRVGVGLFLKGEQDARAWGYMHHVFVDRGTSQPVPIPSPIRAAAEAIAAAGNGG